MAKYYPIEDLVPVAHRAKFYEELNTALLEELMLSTKVWLEKDGVVHPIMITDRNFKYKTQLNEKLINYEIKIEYAYDKINNVR